MASASSSTSNIHVPANLDKERLYYHYTSSEGAEKINEKGEIWASVRSRTGDALFGDGVYMTDMSTCISKKQLPFLKINIRP